MDTGEREAHRQDICRQFRASGMTRKAFCELHGVALSTLGFWLARYGGVSKGSRQSKELIAVGTVSPKEFHRVLRIRAKNGVVFELDLPVLESDIQTVVRAVVGL